MSSRTSWTSGTASAPASSPPSPDALARGLACPQEALDESFLHELVVEHAREFARRFLERAHGQLACRAHGLGALIERWCASEADFASAWHPVQGLVRRSVLVPDDDPLPVAAQLGLHLSACGVPGDWRIRLHEPVRLRFDRWVLPADMEVGIERDGMRCRLVGTSAASAQRAGVPDGALELPALLFGRATATVLQPGAEHAFGASLDPSEYATLPADAILASYARAAGIIGEHAPDYAPWIERVVREIVPVTGELDLIRSSSDEGTPGRVTTSLPAHPAASAEMLIHEASHLYFNLAHRIDDVVNGEDTSLYDSPVKGMPRPLDRILIAYHAFANVALFYDACLASGLEDAGYCATNLARHRTELAILERPLVRTRGLTPLGRHLFEPLAERLERLP